jgi:heme exporter protein B
VTARSRALAGVWAVLRKECLSEWRTRWGLHAALLFAVATLTAVSFAVGRLGERVDVLSALLWVVLLFAALASLAHTFVREVEGRTMTFLRLVASPAVIVIGKLLFNLVFLGVLELVTVPLFLLLMGAPAPDWAAFLGVLALGSLALATAATVLGALVSQTRGRGALFSAVSLPLLMVVLAAGVTGVRAQWEHGDIAPALRLLAAFAVATFAALLVLVDHVWEE